MPTDPTTGEDVQLPADVFDDPGATEHPDQTSDPLEGSPA
jgi:hypothetical protein